MPKRTPKAGDEYVYVGSVPIGIDAGALLPGTTVTVREVVDAGEPGAYDDTEDAVVVEWDAPGVVITHVDEEPYQRPEVRLDTTTREAVLDDNGDLIVDLVDRRRAVPRLGYGTIRRATSIGLVGRTVDADPSIGRTSPITLLPFHELFELAKEA
jgi:hypothetical protein